MTTSADARRSCRHRAEWWEVDGTHHRVSLDTQRGLLAAMGLADRERG